MNAHADEFILVYATFPNIVSAERICHVLLEEKLIACANMIPQVQSLYAWQGKIERSSEIIVFMKSRYLNYQRIESRIKEMHPYDTPAIVQLSIIEGQKDYLAWIKAETTV